MNIAKAVLIGAGVGVVLAFGIVWWEIMYGFDEGWEIPW